MNDTPPHITQNLQELMQNKTSTERYLMSWSMYLTSRQLITQAILEENPDFTEAELKKELFLRFYRDDFNEEQKIKILNHLEKTSSHKRILGE